VPTAQEAFDVHADSEVALVIIDIKTPKRECLTLMDELGE
jgi:YesN/AraC family two-component response regulator